MPLFQSFKARYSFILLLLGLSGCAHLNSDFSCPMQAGLSCQSLDQVNQEIDAHQFSEKSEEATDKPLSIWIPSEVQEAF